MEKSEPERLGTYRCPVCGHGDSVELKDDVAGQRIDCSYCGARLEASEQAAGSDRLTVRLVDTTRPG